MTRKLYRHTVTGVEQTLSDSFARIFGDRFELVERDATDTPAPKRAPRKAKSTEDSADSVGDASTPPAADAAPTSDSSKEGNK